MAGPIDTYVAELARSLPGPGQVRRDMLAELDDGLRDVADAHRASGIPEREAELLAVRQNGSIAQLVDDYRVELAARSGRFTATLLAVTILASNTAWDLIWYVVPSGEPLPGVSVLARVIMFSGLLCAVVCGLGAALLTFSARTPASVRVVNRVLVGSGTVAVALIVGSSLAMNVINIGETGSILGGSAPLSCLVAASVAIVVVQVRALVRTARTTIALGH